MTNRLAQLALLIALLLSSCALTFAQQGGGGGGQGGGGGGGGSCPTATSSTLGCVKPDNTTITISSGVLTAIGSGGDTITSPNSTLNVGGTTTATTLDLAGSAGEIMAGATPALTYTPSLGKSGTAGTLSLFPATGNFTTTLGSAATASNTVNFFATVPTNLHLFYCAVSSTTCTFTDAGYAYNAIPINDVVSATGAIATLANGNNPLTLNCAQTSNTQACVTFGETSAATGGSGNSELALSTAANSTSTVLSITQGAISTVFPTAALNISQGSNTGATNVPAINITSTWNNASLNGPAFLLAVTNTSSTSGAPAFQINGGASATTAEFVVGVAGTVQTNGGYQGTASGTNLVFSGGQSTVSSGSAVGGAIFKGSDDTSSGSGSNGGYAIFRGGMLTNASPNAAALEGVPQLAMGALKGSAIANVGDVLCGTTTAFTVTDCATTPAVNVVGIATATANPVSYVSNGNALVHLDGALTALGDIVCVSTTTAGSGHDNGTAECATPGAHIGVIVADSGTITTASGNTTASTAMSTTLPLVALQIGGGGVGSPSLDQVTGAAAQATGTETAAGHNYTFAGVETSNLTSAFNITNANSTNNNTSVGLMGGATGTSTGGIGALIYDVSGTGDIQRWYTGGSVSNGTYTTGTLEMNISNAGNLTTNGTITADQTTSSCSAPTYTSTEAGTSGLAYINSTSVSLCGNSTENARTSSNGLNIGSKPLIFENSLGGSAEVNLVSATSGLLRLGTGTTAGTTSATTDGVYAGGAFEVQGSTFTASGCSNGTLVGGASAGSYKSGTSGTCTVTVTMGNSITAPNGWGCSVWDTTTTADAQQETTYSQTTVTFSGTTVSGDVIVFACTAF